jgi:hypothetical protein
MTPKRPRQKKRCAKCVPLTEAARLAKAKAAPQALAAKMAAAVTIRQTQPRCSTNSTKIKTANSAKTNSWKWPRPFTSTCGGPAAREFRTVRDSRVTADEDLPGTHDPTGAGRQVHQWARALKAAVTPVAPKVVAMTAAVSMVHHRDMVTIAIVSPAHLKVVTLNANATNAAPKEVDMSASGSLARAAASLNAPEAMASIAIASRVRPMAVASMAHAHRDRDLICV